MGILGSLGIYVTFFKDILGSTESTFYCEGSGAGFEVFGGWGCAGVWHTGPWGQYVVVGLGGGL